MFPIWEDVTEIKSERGLVFNDDKRIVPYPIISKGKYTVLACWPVGKGEIYFLSCPEIFQNQFGLFF